VGGAAERYIGTQREYVTCEAGTRGPRRASFDQPNKKETCLLAGLGKNLRHVWIGGLRCYRRLIQINPKLARPKSSTLVGSGTPIAPLPLPIVLPNRDFQYP
jgi:hypothetical protein